MLRFGVITAPTFFKRFFFEHSSNKYGREVKCYFPTFKNIKMVQVKCKGLEWNDFNLTISSSFSEKNNPYMLLLLDRGNNTGMIKLSVKEVKVLYEHLATFWQ